MEVGRASLNFALQVFVRGRVGRYCWRFYRSRGGSRGHEAWSGRESGVVIGCGLNGAVLGGYGLILRE